MLPPLAVGTQMNLEYGSFQGRPGPHDTHCGICPTSSLITDALYLPLATHLKCVNFSPHSNPMKELL